MTTDKNDLLSFSALREKEVDWYKRNGRHKKRIALDANGNEYVIGDWSWNRGNRPEEFIEPQMNVDISLGR